MLPRHKLDSTASPCTHTASPAGQMAALAYAKAKLGPFHSSHLRDIQRLMGCLVFSRRAATPPSYGALLAPSQWHDLAREFLKHACSLLGHVRALASNAAAVFRQVMT